MNDIARKNAQEWLERVERSPRRQWGWGTPEIGTTSPEERAAYEYLEKKPLVESGELSARDLPEDYGGRPQGSSRRAIRMQQAWDAGYAAELDRQEQLRQIEEFNSQMAIRNLEYQTKSLDLRLKRSDLAADLQNKKIIDEQANIAIGIFGQYPDTPEGLAAATTQINKIAPRAWENEIVGKHYFYKDKNANAVVGAIEAQSADAKQQAQLRADIVTYGITPEQQAAMLESNLPPNVVRFDPLKALPVIAAAKKAQEATKETKAEEKETKKVTTSKEDEYQRSLAEYEGLLAESETANPEDTAKAKAKTRAAAAILGLPKVNSESDLRKYKSGQRVLAPDGITVITIP
jgi:hypothetical protein